MMKEFPVVGTATRRDTRPISSNEMRALLPLSTFLVFSSLLVALLSLSAQRPSPSSGFCAQQDEIQMATTLGGHRDSTAEIDSLARFAVDQHNTKENALLELVRVVKAKEQVVSGKLHHLTLEVLDGGKKTLYEAKVWVKPWMDFKELQEFKHVDDVPSFTSSDLGAQRGEQPSGWQSVPVHDPVVQDAAHHAVKAIQERSNSLLPYELTEVVHATAEVVETSAKFDMVVKVKRGDKEEKFKVEVHRSSEGSFHLNKMDPDRSF